MELPECYKRRDAKPSSAPSPAGEHHGWAERRRALETGRYRASPDGRRDWWRKRLSNAMLDVFGMLLRPTPVHTFGLRNALDLKLIQLELGFPYLPAAFDGYRILHVTDTHLDHLPELAPIARRLLDGIEADMLALTGDVQGTHSAPISLSTRLLEEALEGVRRRTAACRARQPRPI